MPLNLRAVSNLFNEIAFKVENPSQKFKQRVKGFVIVLINFSSSFVDILT